MILSGENYFPRYSGKIISLIKIKEFIKLMENDPVCGMKIEKADAAGQSDYEGQTFYFCSSACKEKFDANPTQYTNKSEI